MRINHSRPRLRYSTRRWSYHRNISFLLIMGGTFIAELSTRESITFLLNLWVNQLRRTCVHMSSCHCSDKGIRKKWNREESAYTWRQKRLHGFPFCSTKTMQFLTLLASLRIAKVHVAGPRVPRSHCKDYTSIKLDHMMFPLSFCSECPNLRTIFFSWVKNQRSFRVS